MLEILWFKISPGKKFTRPHLNGKTAWCGGMHLSSPSPYGGKQKMGEICVQPGENPIFYLKNIPR
jgi:hypothetical protein